MFLRGTLIFRVSKKSDLVGRLFHIQERIQKLENEPKLNARQKELLEKLKEDEKVCNHRLNMRADLPALPPRPKPARAMAEKIFGGLLLCLCVLYWISVLETHLDKTFHSCGWNCRFLLWTITYWTPLDLLLLNSSEFIHILFYSLIVFLLFVSVFLLLKQGIHLMGQKVVQIKFNCTTDHQFLILSGVIVLSNLAWFISLDSALPQYTSFGFQTFCTNPAGTCLDRPDLLYSCQVTSNPGKVD